jgi:DNA-binding transcriptional regulator PaaX
MKIEQERWMVCMLDKQQEELKQKNKQLRQKLEKERDAKIQMLIGKISEENQKLESELMKKS